MIIATPLTYVVMLYALKAACVGSEFSLWKWARHGRTYTDWYWKRETFIECLGKQ